MIYEAVGRFTLDNVSIEYFGSLEDPLFRVKDIAKLIGYRADSSSQLLNHCERRDYLKGSYNLANSSGKGSGSKICMFVTEKGMYKILARTKTSTAMKWTDIISSELVRLRKAAGRNIEDQFSEYARANESNMDDEWFDEETGKWMYACTVPGGDVEIFEKRMPF